MLRVVCRLLPGADAIRARLVLRDREAAAQNGGAGARHGHGRRFVHSGIRHLSTKVSVSEFLCLCVAHTLSNRHTQHTHAQVFEARLFVVLGEFVAVAQSAAQPIRLSVITGLAEQRRVGRKRNIHKL